MWICRAAGLIPADLETWKVRRRAIVPGFHAAWLEEMNNLFGDCAQLLVDKLDKAAEVGASLPHIRHIPFSNLTENTAEKLQAEFRISL